MKTWLKILALVGTACLILMGCGKGGGSGTLFTPEKATLFASDANLKAIWDSAAAAMKTNDYFTAGMSLRALLSQPNLSPQQSAALTDTMFTLNEQMTKKAAKGDPDAKRAMDEFKKAGG